MRVIIDRFEGNYAVCEKNDGSIFEIEVNKIPKNAKEGDVLNIEKDKIIINSVETEERKKEILNATKDIWK